MFLGDVGIQLNAEARFIANDMVTLLDHGPIVNHEVLPPVDVFGQLVYAEVAHGSGGVARSDGADRASGVVRGSGNVIVIRQIMNALTLQQATGLRNINVDDVAALNLDQTAEFIAGVEVLTGGHGNVNGMSYTRHHFGIAGRHRIFEPHGLGRLNHFGHLDSIANVVLPVRFDTEVNIGAQFLPHRHHRFFDTPQIFQCQPAGITIVAGFGVSGISFRRNAIALELISRPPKFFGFRLLN